MESTGPAVFSTVHDDGSADFTISVDDEDHRFSTNVSGDMASLSYEETQSWRGQIRVKAPREEIWRLLIQSREMTEYLESNSLKAVRRE